MQDGAGIFFDRSRSPVMSEDLVYEGESSGRELCTAVYWV